ncbi:MAG: repressor LexA [Deltaproteobacteria bacterium]|nr:repressor LexA [Deltaproteobacteria bacterium]MBW1951482.1 repressor LexA [Deltaproteobacteria bacterium]MBW1986911.1 repressor LexA [Deltaproteobacteria bacterium]MBW2135021.1 repressor LexA [Deltaproteobacteria bacterium]
MRALTDRQRAVLTFIEEFCHQQGYPPTVREVAAHFGIQPRAAADHLSALKRKGYLHREPGRSRGLALRSRSLGNTVEVPLLGQIAAGRPLWAVEQIEDTIPLPEAWVRGDEVFLLRVSGDSMAPLLLPGDLVIVRVQSQLGRGEIGVVRWGEEATIKRVYQEPDGLVLKGDNPDFAPLRLTPEQAAQVQVLGRVIGVYRALGAA